MTVIMATVQCCNDKLWVLVLIWFCFVGCLGRWFDLSDIYMNADIQVFMAEYVAR